MEYGIHISFFTKQIPMAQAARLVAEAGFTMLDYNPPLNRDDWQVVMKQDLAVFREYGLTVHQTHAPFNRYGQYGDQFALCLERCMEATALMGAKYCVAHGDEFDFGSTAFSPQAALQHNHDIYEPYVRMAERTGFKIAFETVFEDGCFERRYTSDADELLTLIRSFHSDHAVCCWDFGHSNIAFGQNAPQVIRRLGSLIQCTHLHDNVGHHDSHQLPLTGNINWPATMQAFADIGYQNVLSVEYAYGSFPPHLIGDFLKLTQKSAQYLWNQKT